MFKKLCNKESNKGYISIEMIIIAGLVISLGSFLLFKFGQKGQSLQQKTNESLIQVGENIDSEHDKLFNKQNENDSEVSKYVVDKKRNYYAHVGKDVTPTPVEYFDYVLNEDGSVSLTGYKGKDKDIVLPYQIDGHLVTTVEEYAFRYNATPVNNAFNQGAILNSVVIPDSITTIERFAFRNNEITSITLHKNITSIGHNAFTYNNLTEIDLSMLNDNVEWGKHPITYNQISKVKWWDNIEKIPEGIFERNSFTTIDESVIPSTVKEIGNRAFSWSLIKEVDLSHLSPDIVLGVNLFENNYTKTVKWMDKSTTIEEKTF